MLCLSSRTSPRCGTATSSVVPPMQTTLSETCGTVPLAVGRWRGASPCLTVPAAALCVAPSSLLPLPVSLCIKAEQNGSELSFGRPEMGLAWRGLAGTVAAVRGLLAIKPHKCFSVIVPMLRCMVCLTHVWPICPRQHRNVEVRECTNGNRAEGGGLPSADRRRYNYKSRAASCGSRPPGTRSHQALGRSCWTLERQVR